MRASKEKKRMITIQIEAELAELLKDCGRMGDTYSVVIRRLLNGQKPAVKGDPHEDKGDKTDESTGNGHQQTGQERG